MSMELELCPACRAGEPRKPVVSGRRYCAVCLDNPSAAWKRVFRRENGGRNELSEVDSERYRVWHREYAQRWRAARRSGDGSGEPREPESDETGLESGPME